MTDVSNLGDLAGKIASRGQENIKKFAVAIASATISQETDIRKLKTDLAKAKEDIEVLKTKAGGGTDLPPDEDPPPPPPSGNNLFLSGSMTGSAFMAAVAAAPPGNLTVQPATGQTLTVTSPFTLTRQNVTIKNTRIQDITLTNASNGFTMDGGRMRSLYTDGCSNVIIKNCDCDHQHIADSFGNSGWQVFNAINWQVLNCHFHGHTVDADPEQHTEAIFMAAGCNGWLIQGCTFEDGGSTGHLFFSYLGTSPSDFAGMPKNVCVKGCTFFPPINPYWFIDMRSEIPNSNNIDIEPAPSNTFNFQGGSPVQQLNNMAWLRTC